MVILLCLGAFVFFVLRAAGRRKAVLAGLQASKPVFMAEPPTRRLGKPGRF